MMLLKFGRVVDLDKLEGLSTNRIVEELMGKLMEMETWNSREIAALEVSHSFIVTCSIVVIAVGIASSHLP